MKKTAVIETKSGKVQGYCESGLEIFKGIPYAEPPVEDLRFAPPVDKQPWDEVLETTNYSSCAYQGFTALEKWLGKLTPESEDCLTLNIWTPAADNKKRPVMFWIHGGAFIMGGGTDRMYDGSALVKRGDVVIITINYRLGAFGFLYIPGVTVNNGSLDQILALKWVHDNILNFGGDPSNITIFGESAGAYSVISLCAMPAAKGLFRRVIAQSAPFISPEVTEKPTKNLFRILGIKNLDIEAFRQVPPEQIIKAQNEFFAKDPLNLLAFRPLIDGKIFPKHPLKAFQEGECKNIDFIIGTNLDEAKLFTALDPRLNAISGPGGEKLLIGAMGMMGIPIDKGTAMVAAYKKLREGKYSTEPKEILNAFMTDFMFRVSTVRLLEAQSVHHPNSYNYLFTWLSPGILGDLGACHALELPFVFNTLGNPKMDSFAGKGPEAQSLSQKMMDAWIAFVHNGNPNHKNLPKWPPYDVEKRATMVLGKDCKILNAAFDEERKTWDGLQKV